MHKNVSCNNIQTITKRFYSTLSINDNMDTQHEVPRKTILIISHILDMIGPIKNKLELHKTLYILKEMGVDIDLHFKWYTMGPYCSELWGAIEHGKMYYSIIDWDENRDNPSNIRSTKNDINEYLCECGHTMISKPVPNKYGLSLLKEIEIDDKLPIYKFITKFGKENRDTDYILMIACLNYLYNNQRKWDKKFDMTRAEALEKLMKFKFAEKFSIKHQNDIWGTMEFLGLVETEQSRMKITA